MKQKVKQATKKTKQRTSIISELFQFLWQAKLWWLAPILIIFLIFGLLLIFTEGSALAPFLYTLF
jgi:LPS O-antigen subunit length determinant protein (WzzB/FepE family)